MGFWDRFFPPRETQDDLQINIKKVERTGKTFLRSLLGKPPQVRKDCPVCNTPNLEENRVCRKCQHVFW
jgi:hypothetical protein